MNNQNQNKRNDQLFTRINSARAQLNQMESILESMYRAMDGIDSAVAGFEKALPSKPEKPTTGHFNDWTEKDSIEVKEISNRLAEKHYGNNGKK